MILKTLSISNPVFEEQLSDTYGIIVYQEDVIKIAEGFAKLHPNDGDVLRRAMSGKNRSLRSSMPLRISFLPIVEIWDM